MNIVQVSPYSLSRKGGVQRHVLDLSSALKDRGHNVLCIGPGEDVSADVIGVGSMRPISLAGTRFELSRASTADLQHLDQRLKHFNPDIMHYHTMWVPMLPWQIFRRSPYASVATFHDTTTPDATGAVLRALFRPLSRYLLNRLDGAITVSSAPLAHLRPGPHGATPAIVPPATDLSRFLNASKTAGAEEGPFTVLFVGRLEPRKGVTVLLTAWGQVLESFAGALPPRLIIAGSGELLPEVQAAMDKYKGSIQHIANPSDDELPQVMADAHLVVAPSLYGESFGIILVEALASGTPVIGGANPGYKHVLTGREGATLLVAPGDATALAQRITALLGDPQQRQHLGQWGRAHASTFDVKAQIPRFQQIYAQALKHHKRSLDRSHPRRA